ncbi:hypothetical protein BTVI_131470 [Pitangus sulphuratus]|nr:hypothetical protein BTVI_131470 [Pitangus sulphuratus]
MVMDQADPGVVPQASELSATPTSPKRCAHHVSTSKILNGTYGNPLQVNSEWSGKRIKKTRKYDIITTPAERVEMAPLNEEDDEDEDSTVFDVKYSFGKRERHICSRHTCANILNHTPPHAPLVVSKVTALVLYKSQEIVGSHETMKGPFLSGRQGKFARGSVIISLMELSH